ncbi:MAG: HWE histidine kinase domain-containing protein, partial [Saprospiraceae bacterium]
VENEEIRLHPRSSFNHFKKLNTGSSEIWNTETIVLAEVALKTFKNSVVLEKASSERLKTIVQELNHRLRNVLTLVRSISRQMAEDTNSVEEYVDSLEYRILALAKSNSLLSATNYEAVYFKELLLRIIPSISNDSHRITLVGEDIKLVSNSVPIMVLIIHELTTNALKYGSLSVKEGELCITWFLEKQDLIIEWKETNGPSVEVPKKKGFGSTIIKNAIEYEFSGTSEMTFMKTGLVARFTIPANLVGENKETPFVLEQVKDVALNEVLIKTKKLNVLVLEDDFMISKNMESVITKLAVNKVNAFSNQKMALSSLNEMEYHLAFLDVNLKNETSIDVATFCNENNIPFYYTTGYGRSFLDEGEFPISEVLLKPLDTKKLQKIINDHLLIT